MIKLNQTNQTNMISHPELWTFATTWYRYLDVHAPLDSFRPLVTQDVEFVFPEATVKGFEGYTGWYNTVVKIFFDEVHTLKTADIQVLSDNMATVHVVVNWQASTWQAPNSSSTRFKMDADQTWDVVKTDSGLQIARYVVNAMTYETASCKL
jgi:hypothetical protein